MTMFQIREKRSLLVPSRGTPPGESASHITLSGASWIGQAERESEREREKARERERRETTGHEPFEREKAREAY